MYSIQFITITVYSLHFRHKKISIGRLLSRINSVVFSAARILNDDSAHLRKEIYKEISNLQSTIYKQ